MLYPSPVLMFPETALTYVPELSFHSMLVNNELARIIDIYTQSLVLIYGIKDFILCSFENLFL